MKTLPLLTCCILLALPAFSRELLLSRFPYTPEEPPQRTLNLQNLFQENPPPVFSPAPLEMPDHLQFSREEFVWVEQLREGYQRLAQQDYSAAEEIFSSILNVYPNHPPSRIALADIHFAQNNYQEAERQYLEILEDHPRFFQVLNNIAWMYVSTDNPQFRNPEQALNFAQRAILENPNNHHVWNTYSSALYQTGSFQQAANAARRALALAQRTRADNQTLINYLNHLTKTLQAQNATILME